MKKIVEKMKNKIIKIEKLKDKTKNKYNDLRLSPIFRDPIKP